jgi:hypothetical protein
VTTSGGALPKLPPMVLHTLPSYPQSRAYVLQLHRDAAGQPDVLLGRIVHIASGDSAEFASGAALLAWLRARLAAAPAAPAAHADGSHTP